MPRTALSVVFLTLPLLAQQPAFEVAAIKSVPRPSTEDTLSGKSRPSITVDASQVTIRFWTLSTVILRAYGIKTYQLTAPAWTNDLSSMFEIVAKLPEGGKPEQVPEMLQALLKDRFKLAVHRETKDLSIYTLVVGKNGPKLKEAAPDATALFKGGPFVDGVSHIHLIGDMPSLISAMSPYLSRAVFDLTDLKGKYDMDLAVTRDSDTAPTGLPVLDFNGALETLGLKLDARKEPVEMLVVDHVEKTPTEN